MRKKNVILITFDSGRADHFGFMGYHKDVSPFLDSLSREGVYFKKAFSTGPGSPQSFVSILTSTYPLDYGGYQYIGRPRIVISEVFKKAGYRTIGVHSAAYLSGYFGYDRGWDDFRYISPFYGGGEVSPGLKEGTWQVKIVNFFMRCHDRYLKKHSIWDALAIILEKTVFLPRKIAIDIAVARGKTKFRPAYTVAEETNTEVKSALPKKTKEPVFLWVHYMDPHGPYGLFQRKGHGFVRAFKYYAYDYLSFYFGFFPSIINLFKWLFVDIYDSSIQHMDGQIKELFAYLRDIGVVDDEAVVAVASDHGEEFYDHGDFGHLPKLYNVNLHVPLILWSPKYVIKSVEERPVSLMDISPTLLKLAGVRKPGAFKGGDLLDRRERPCIAQIVDEEADLSNPVFLGATVIYKNHQLIHWSDKKILFALNGSHEKKNLYHQKAELVRELAEILKPYERISPPGKHSRSKG